MLVVVYGWCFPFLAMSKQKYEKVVDYQQSQILLIMEAALSS